jgi:heme/copper-type cytochrome/quinol oxidase subunit 4
MLYKICLSLLLIVHGMLHIAGYRRIKATGTGLRGHRIAWVLATVLFLIAFLLLLADVTCWWAVCAIAIPVSQLLIFMNWSLARWGTVANLLLLAAMVLSLR